MARDTVPFLGATGGRFGIDNETTVGGGLLFERVNVGAGLSLAAFSLPICGPRLCGQIGPHLSPEDLEPVPSLSSRASLSFHVSLLGPYFSDVWTWVVPP